jgi:hypothetical protein
MRLTIDNLDGRGGVDYTATIDRSQPVEILRALNEPSILKATLCLAASTLPTPARRGRIVAIADAGTVLFTGYLAIEPTPAYAGEASAGPVYRLALSAVSDEWLLDKQGFGGAALGLGVDSQSYALRLAEQVAGVTLPATTSSAGLPASGFFAPPAGASWSTQVGQLASTTASAYRLLGGSLALTGAGGVEHTISDGDGSLHTAALKTSSVRELANDITVTGADEPGAYFTELFTGDGTTAVFALSGEPAAPSAGHAALIADNFDQPMLNGAVWSLSDPGAHLSLTGAGLTATGGNGQDGTTTLTAWNPVELGGTLVLELANVALAAGSAGVLGGLYAGPIAQAACFAGFNIRQSAGQTIATPLVNGSEVGTSSPIVPGHLYTLRLHLHCPELVRLRQVFYAFSESSGSLAVSRFGGGALDAPISLVFEVRDLAASSNTPVTILYDGSLADSPAQASFVAMNSLNLIGSVGAVHLIRTGTAWIRSISASGTPWTRLAGKSADGVDCSVTSSAEGHVTFFSGRVPAAGETIEVSYRGRRRAVARVADPTSLAAEAAGGAVGTARWLGHIVSPPARTSEDCEFAAQAILSFAASRAAALSGSYTAVNPPAPDLWPGDLLTLNTNGSTLSAILRKVTILEQGAAPEVLTYHLAFANDWAQALSLRLSETVPADTLLPATTLDLTPGTPPVIPPHVLANLQQITVAAPAGSALAVDAGLNPPAGGGFEVRRRDGGFGSGSGSAAGDLVLRSPVRGLSIPLAALEEAFYVRMYDASTPPLYSRNSAAILTHLPAS